MTVKADLAVLLACLGVVMPVQMVSAEAREAQPLAAKVEIWRHSRLEATRTEAGVSLLPFTTDGCSGGMSAAWEALALQFPGFYEVFENQAPWHDCCVVHDQAYHLGGADPTPEASYFARLTADEALRQCVRDVGEADSAALAVQYDWSEATVQAAISFTADRMYDAVRLGGLPCSGLSWRWGYGWPQCW
ncbi:hypothetical protein [Shimia sp. R11_0]|uniref:hypothetical protein n=1 Tax=Shimia sp. R11_0 TaxID=2821096 RepID=UPI001FFE094C|nr:hypothetical protein [Shimia sp. R11_0]